MAAILTMLVLSSALLSIGSASQCHKAMYTLPRMCVTGMARGSYPACDSIDLTYERRICELRNVSDTRMLNSLGNIVGQVS